jgi:predicted transposase YbfD/YdcC
MPTHDTAELFTPFFENLTDPRLDRTRRHTLMDIIILAVCATLGNANGWADIERFGKAKLAFFRTFLDLPNGIPSHDTFGRVFARLDPAQLMACIQQWLDALGTAVAGEVVAIDGKTLRGSFDTAAGKNPLHLVSAWACNSRLILGQVAVDAKSNEITAIPLLLELLDLKGCTVTIDAMGCQKEIASAIRGRDADYVRAVKDNQPGLHQALHDAFVAYAENSFADPALKHFKRVERSHGRDETREYWIAEAPAALVEGGLWQDLNSIGMVSRTRVVNGVESNEIAYFVSSLAPKVKAFANAVRGHWGIENRLHWTLDVTFAEDSSRARKGHSPLNLGMLRRLALSILQQDTTVKDNLRGKRLRAGWDETVLLKILTGFSRN